MQRVLATFLAVGASIGVVRAEPEPRGRGGAITSTSRSLPRITVRVYDSLPVDARARGDAVTHTRRLLGSAGVPSEFHDCTPGVNTVPRLCQTAPGPGELIVRLIRSNDDATPAARHVLGFAMIDATTRRGTMATVFADRVAALSTRAKVPLETVLSRTMAHEIGHLLLGTNEHGPRGLMREEWTVEDLANGSKEHWSFTAAELARLHGPA